MYARVGITTDTNKDALVVPADALADLGGRRGVFQVLNDTAVFRTVQVGTEQQAFAEIVGGLNEGDEVITTGARALRDGDRIVLAAGSDDGRQGGRGRGGAGAAGQAPAATAGAAPSAAAPPADVPAGGAREGGRRGRAAAPAPPTGTTAQ
jgi:hypothetical protein